MHDANLTDDGDLLIPCQKTKAASTLVAKGHLAVLPKRNLGNNRKLFFCIFDATASQKGKALDPEGVGIFKCIA